LELPQILGQPCGFPVQRHAAALVVVEVVVEEGEQQQEASVAELVAEAAKRAEVWKREHKSKRGTAAGELHAGRREPALAQRVAQILKTAADARAAQGRAGGGRVAATTANNPGWCCENGCGFKGSFDTVEAHEATCGSNSKKELTEIQRLKKQLEEVKVHTRKLKAKAKRQAAEAKRLKDQGKMNTNKKTGEKNKKRAVPAWATGDALEAALLDGPTATADGDAIFAQGDVKCDLQGTKPAH
jgi:hypothetical protein